VNQKGSKRIKSTGRFIPNVEPNRIPSKLKSKQDFGDKIGQES
jgi:hypothetical protein